MSPQKSPVSASISRDAVKLPRPIAWAGLTAVAAVAALIAAILPAALALPAASILLVTAGLTIAAVCYLTRSGSDCRSMPAWNVAGALVFLGFAAAIMTDTREALSMLAHIETQGLASLPR
jgi:hypothetical protein